MEYSKSRPRISGRLLGAILIAVISVVSYFATSSVNPITGESQRVSLSTSEEIALGLQARSEMARQFGGLDPDTKARERVSKVGARLLERGLDRETPYRFEFHLLADSKTVNAFALPGGQIFITRALYDALKSEDQLAGVLAHEVGHVLERHSAQQMAKAQLTAGLTNAAVLATYDPDNPTSQGAGMLAAVVGQLASMKFGRNDELKSDHWGVMLTHRAEYDPTAMIDVMKILEAASGSGANIEFLSTHPSSSTRIAALKGIIAEELKRRLN